MTDPKWHGTIQTDKHYNDAAETELMLESFEFNGHRITLPHPLDDDGYRNPDYVSVDTKSEYGVTIHADRIEIFDPSGYTIVNETFDDLARKCGIADKLAAVNRWK